MARVSAQKVRGEENIKIVDSIASIIGETVCFDEDNVGMDAYRKNSLGEVLRLMLLQSTRG
jgi:hypothetical protein